MTNSSIQKITRLLAALGVLFFTSSLYAGGPLGICNTGEAFLWPNGGDAVPFNPDQGGLGILDNAAATTAVGDAFQAWEDVASATINYNNAGTLPVDVDISNFGPYLEATDPDGLSAIVFDDSGEIFELIFGAGSGILGFAGPEWVDFSNCTITEGYSFLNGPAIGTLDGLLNLMVHEFGHYSNLAHTEVNGQLFIGVGDTSGPGSDNTFGFAPFPDGVEVIATMYPFLFGSIDQLARTPNADDIGSLSTLYPEPDFAATSASIRGTIFAGANKVTGVNVIARNVDDPFVDAVSAISSDFTDDFSQDNPYTGIYTIDGLTPGASYAVYVDEILAGGFSTPLATPLPGPEEFYNGANESANGITDVPNQFVAITPAAGIPETGIDIIFNIPPPGSPLATGDDGNVEIPLPFKYCMAGQAYGSVYINGNGFITFGSADTSLTFIESAADFVTGPARIAGYWDDLSPNQGGSVYYQQTDNTFTVTWDDVPEWLSDNSNTFSIELNNNSSSCVDGDKSSNSSYAVKITHGHMDSADGLVGVSAGIFATSGFETEDDLTAISNKRKAPIGMQHDAAVFEQFSSFDSDIANGSLTFRKVGAGYKDSFEPNNSVKTAAVISLPFRSDNTQQAFTSISPSGADVDFYRMNKRLKAGTTFVAEVLSGQTDTMMVLGVCLTDIGPGGNGSQNCKVEDIAVLAFNDDSNGLLSRIQIEVPVDGTYVLGVTYYEDFGFDGTGPGQGEPFDSGRYVLDVYTVDGVLLPIVDESFAEFELGFDFPYQGISYSSIFVNDNGYATFGNGEVFNFIPNAADMESGLPRIAPLWVDLDPSNGGMILASRGSGTATINYMDIPEFGFGGSNSFSMTLNADGSTSMSYNGMTAPEGITGLGAGDTNPGNVVDLSDAASWSATGTTFEQFYFGLSDFDLDGETITFDP